VRTNGLKAKTAIIQLFTVREHGAEIVDM